MGEAGHEPPEDEPADESQQATDGGEGEAHAGRPNPAQRRYLARGLKQAGGKLPLFDEYGQHIHPALVRACIAHGWAEPWFGNPLKADWLVCRLTDKGRAILAVNDHAH
jgi:hypothetical protein